jgi:hypothetical protein
MPSHFLSLPETANYMVDLLSFSAFIISAKNGTGRLIFTKQHANQTIEWYSNSLCSEICTVLSAVTKAY